MPERCAIYFLFLLSSSTEKKKEKKKIGIYFVVESIPIWKHSESYLFFLEILSEVLRYFEQKKPSIF